jgi:LysR family transcriptional regulator, glycine cleavage system transcriptional activator
MPRRLPPLNALKAFEAAARHESFTRAAEELCVTQGAVSHQVKALEAELGLKLFNRERQRLVITEAGRAYLVVVRDAFDRIGDGTERLLQRQRGGALTVSTSPNFAAKWLVHRLGRFAETHPEIDLRVSASMQHVDFAREDIDLAIRHGDGTDTGLQVTRLCTEELFPVCSPKLLNGRNRLRAPSDLSRFALLHVNDRQGWRQWLDFAGVGDVDAARGPILNQASMAIDAAVDGQGVALARTALAAWDLIGGRLGGRPNGRPRSALYALPAKYNGVTVSRGSREQPRPSASRSARPCPMPATSAPRTRDGRQGLRKTRPTSSARRRRPTMKRRAAVRTNRRGLPSDGSARSQAYHHSSVAFFILPIAGLDPSPVLEPRKQGTGTPGAKHRFSRLP